MQGIREARKSPAKQRSQFPTGFDRLDGMLGGGPRESHLVIVAAATSGGKTSLALNMGLNMAGQGIPAAMLSLEMARDELTMRGAAALSDGEDPDSGLNAIERLPFVISDNPDLSAEGARTMVKMLSARYGTKVVILDYLQLLRESGSRTSNREREVAGMSRSLKLAAKETADQVDARYHAEMDASREQARQAISAAKADAAKASEARLATAASAADAEIAMLMSDTLEAVGIARGDESLRGGDVGTAFEEGRRQSRWDGRGI